MATRDICLWTHSLQTWGYSESREENNRGGEDVNKAIKTCLLMEKKRGSPVVAYEHFLKHVANLKKKKKNSINRHDKPPFVIIHLSYDPSHALFSGKSCQLIINFHAQLS